MKRFVFVVLLPLLHLSSIAQAQSFREGWPQPSDQITLFVSPIGNDLWSGRLLEPNRDRTDGPFQHFERARAYVQGLDKSRLSRIAVLFRGGVYQLPATLNFTSADSGSTRTEVIYQNFPGESPVFTGGMRLQHWTNTGANTWQTTLPLGAVPFDNLYYNGERRLRPRVGGYLGQFFRTFHTVYVAAKEPNCPFKDNQGDAHDGQFECFDRFQYDPAPADNNNPFADPWTNLSPNSGNLCPGQAPGNPALWGDIEILVFEQFSTSKLPVSCVDTKTHTVYLSGHTAAPAGAHASETGFIETDRYLVENVKNALTQPGQWYLDRSAGPTHPMTLTYLARPGEDPNRDEVIVPQLSQLLVASGLHDVTFRGLTFQHDNYVVPFPQGHISTELDPDVPSAVSFQNTSHVTFDSNTLRKIAGTGLGFLSCVTDPLGPTDTTEAPVAECVATAAAPDLTGNIISNSVFYDIGVQGIRIGEQYIATDNDSNVPQRTVVENNVVEGYGRTIPAAFGIGQGFGHHNLYTHNDVYDGYHCAISISTNAGDIDKPNGIADAYNTISFNHVHDLLQGIMNDGGAIRIDGGNDAYTAPGNKIFNNKIHDINDASVMDSNGYGGHGIYLDNATGLVDVENNLVYRVSDSAVYTPHGPAPKPLLNFPHEPNLVRNNILAYARLGMIEQGSPAGPAPTTPAQVAQSFIVTNNLMYFDRNLNSTSPFQGASVNAPFNLPQGCTYTPFVYPLYQEFGDNLYWRTDGALADDTKAFNVQDGAFSGANAPCAGSRIAHAAAYNFYPFSKWQTEVGEDRHSIVHNPHFAHPAYPYDDYSLNFWEWDGWPNVGFIPFDPNEAGRYRFYPHVDPPPVPATFATATYNPATDF